MISMWDNTSGKLVITSMVVLVCSSICMVHGVTPQPEQSGNGSTKVIKTGYGELKGLQRISKYDGTEYWSFQGVPYAKPPVGNLRFKAPEVLEPWQGVRDALKEGNRPPQYDIVTKTFTGDEDCLFLNVYVPQVPDKVLLPVMVFIYGGGFAYGHGDTEMYGPEFLMNKSVILVTVNYRIGILGFLNLGIVGASGNMGLKDQTAALQWVKKEIQNFGGDPMNVTLFGQSAGAASVHFHMMSPLSKGLFHKAILMSGSAMASWAFTKNHLQRAFDLGKLLGCNATSKEDLLKFLNTVAPKTFAGIQDNVISLDEHLAGVDQAFVPTVDGEFLVEEPLECLKKGKIYDIPTIVGVTSHEGFLMHYSVKTIPLFLNKLNEKLEVVIPYPFKNSTQIGQELRKLYFGNAPNISMDVHSAEFYQLFTHSLFLLPMILSLKYELLSRKQPVYMYQFSYDGHLGWYKNLLWGKDEKPKGVSHVDELGYLLSNDLVNYQASADDNDKKMVNQFTKLWTDFAKKGNPNSPSPGVTGWKPFGNVANYNYLNIAGPLNFDMKQNLDKDKIDFWMSKL